MTNPAPVVLPPQRSPSEPETLGKFGPTRAQQAVKVELKDPFTERINVFVWLGAKTRTANQTGYGPKSHLQIQTVQKTYNLNKNRRTRHDNDVQQTEQEERR